MGLRVPIVENQIDHDLKPDLVPTNTAVCSQLGTQVRLLQNVLHTYRIIEWAHIYGHMGIYALKGIHSQNLDPIQPPFLKGRQSGTKCSFFRFLVGLGHCNPYMVVSQNKGTYYGPQYGNPPKNYHYFTPILRKPLCSSSSDPPYCPFNCTVLIYP